MMRFVRDIMASFCSKFSLINRFEVPKCHGTLLVAASLLVLVTSCATRDPLPPAPRAIGENQPNPNTSTSTSTNTSTSTGLKTGGSSSITPHRKVGSPYKVAGVWYYPKEEPTYDKTGVASWYGTKFHGRSTANGELFDMNRMTAAHPTLPLPSTLKVTNLSNGRSIYVRLNDRGPFASDRILDLSRAAAEQLGYRDAGLAQVRVEYVAEANLADAITTLGGAKSASGQYAATATPRPIRSDRKMNTVKTRIITGPESLRKTPSFNTQVGGANLNRPVVGQTASAGTIAPPIAMQAPIRVSRVNSGSNDFIYTRPTMVAPMPEATSGIALYMVQIGAYASSDNADKVADKFPAQTPIRTAQVTTESGRPLYRVRLGPFRAQTEAEEALQLARQAGFVDARLVRP